MNTDEALKCLKLAQRYRDAKEYASARKFAQKSINLASTSEAIKLLAVINAEANSSSKSSASSSKASGAESHPSASTTHSRSTASSSTSESSSTTKKITYTDAQVKLVRRVRTCKITDYYEILELEKSCEEADVKKAYRKLALQLHPDKNGAPGADEAFKMVSKAFQILSDPQKRAVFDQSGGDPDSRASGMASPGMARAFAGGRQFEGEISPEDLFNMFFGGGMGGQMGGGGQFGGGGFGGGPVFTASFGPGGFRTTRVRPRGAANAANAAEPQSARSLLLQLAPLLILFLFSFLTSLPSLFTTPSPPDPSFTFSPYPPYISERLTSTLEIPYYVSPADFSAHPIWATIPDSHKNVAKAGSSSRQLSQFERSIEKYWHSQMVHKCEREIDVRDRKIEANSGWLGVGADWEAVKKLRQEKLESCEQLKTKKIISGY
ncbi:DnaJ-domain-containing protein [Ramaria rubella]|nr:DnaJ-domain-containing protein [Ramaria rubella]